MISSLCSGHWSTVEAGRKFGDGGQRLFNYEKYCKQQLFTYDYIDI